MHVCMHVCIELINRVESTSYLVIESEIELPLVCFEIVSKHRYRFLSVSACRMDKSMPLLMKQLGQKLLSFREAKLSPIAQPLN